MTGPYRPCSYLKYPSFGIAMAAGLAQAGSGACAGVAGDAGVAGGAGGGPCAKRAIPCARGGEMGAIGVLVSGGLGAGPPWDTHRAPPAPAGAPQTRGR